MNHHDGWKDKYFIKQYYSDNFPPRWVIYSNRWHSVRPMKRISPYFFSFFEAEEWIQTRWKSHIDNKIDRMLLL
jgi:macrodomain Ter protein organizer (MatP/YcbG family)